MTDTSTVQEQIQAIRATKAEEEAKRAAAVKADEERCAKIDAVKAVCFKECGEVVAALAEATDLTERQALIELEAQVHASHKDALEAAHFAASGQSANESNQAQPGETSLEASVVVTSEVPLSEA